MFQGKVTGWLEAGYSIASAELCHGRLRPSHYELHGGPIVRVDRRFLEHDELPTHPFSIGSYCFYPLGHDFARNAIIAAHINGPLWWLPVVRYWLESIGQRLLATAYVWGLAEWPVNEKQTWRSVHALRWLAKRLGRV